MKMSIRVGIGHDRHRLGPGEFVRLGGIDIPHDKSMLGHSDADAFYHAVTDALLGAAALGDIGEMFPDTDPVNKGRDSAEMLAVAHQKIASAGWAVVNIDCIVFAQKPKITPYKMKIRENLARLLKIDVDCVGLKAKTGELVGPVGREEAIEAQCVVLLERNEPS